MKYNMTKKVCYSIIIAAMAIGFTLIAIFGIDENGSGSAKDINLGLDLAGGVSITYEIQEDNPTSQDVDDTIYKLQKRVEGKSTESQVYKAGDNRITVEIPGVTDANEILQELGTPGSLEFLDSDGYAAWANGEEYTPLLTGSDVKGAQAYTDTSSNSSSSFGVQLTFTDEGSTKFAEATKANLNKIIYIVYDGEVKSAPTVQSEITGGTASITNMESYESADTLATFVRIGSIPLTLQEVSSNIVGAQLGHDAITTSLYAAILGLVLLCVFMIAVYRIPGVVATIALWIYTAGVLILVSVYDLTLTLPGIAGIILGIGMAVDANVIIFARVKEELSAGASVHSALRAGFHKAMSAILDGNITTLIAAAVLWLRGSGPVKGFAQTLALGIVVSMFTALVVTRLLVYSFYAIGIRNPKVYGRVKEERKPIDFLGKKKVFFVVSIALCLSGFVVMGINSARDVGALNYSLDFVGGTATTVTFDKEYTLEEVDSQMVPELEKITGDKNVQVQTVKGTNQVVFKTQTLDLEKREAFESYMQNEFGVKEEIATENISSTVSSEMRMDAVIAVIIATIFMLLYIWFRFKDIRFATSAVVALLHDVLVVLAFYAIARVSVGNTFIACMLTIVGYSINATIVIFDRIREEMKNSSRNTDLKDLVNRCITQTLTRSIYTSLTTFVMVAVLYVMGVSSIKEFALPLMAGIVCGAYSSVCITGALWYVMKTGKNAKVQAASVPAKQVESVKTESSEESSSDGNVQKAAKSKTKKKKKRR